MEADNKQDVNKIYIMLGGDQCYEKQKIGKEGMRSSGVGGVEILHRVSG